MSMYDRSRLNPPGGKLGFADIPANSPLSPVFDRWDKILGGEHHPFAHDPDFIAAFSAAISDPREQELYLRHTARFLHGESADFNYVLSFRRSLPSDIPKPEPHWTTDYITALRGLRQEIPGDYRLHTIILVTTLGQLSRYGFAEDQNFAQSDGEIKIINTPVDSRNCLVSFRPFAQQQQLDEYLAHGGKTLVEFTALLKQKHSGSS